MNDRICSRKRKGLFSQTVVWLSALLLCWQILPLSAAPALPGQEIKNTVVVTYSNETGAIAGRVTASASVFLSGAPILQITRLEHSSPVYLGQELLYTIEYRNAGDVPAINTVLTDQLSDFVTFQAASGNGTFIATRAGGSVRWNLGDLAPGQSGLVTVSTLVHKPEDYPPGDPAAIGPGSVIPNTATLRADNLADAIQASTSTAVTAGVILELHKTAQPAATAVPGGQIEYTLHYRNTGSLTATGIELSDTLPPGTSYVPGSASLPVSSNPGQLLCAVPDLPPGGNGELRFLVTVDQGVPVGQSLVNQAGIRALSVPLLMSNAVQTLIGAETSGLKGRVYDSVTGKSLTEVKVWLLKGSAAFPESGHLPAPDDKAELPDPATHPGAIQLNPLTSNGKGEYEWPVLPAGNYRLWVETASSGYTYASKNPAPQGSIQLGSHGEEFSVDTATLSIDLPLDPAAAQLSLTKEASRISASIGDTVEYLLKISNSGGPAAAVEVVDNLPEGLLYLQKTSRLNGRKVADPAVEQKQTLIWQLGDLEAGAQLELRYRVQVGGNVHRQEVTNAAFARGTGSTGKISSSIARHKLIITEGVFTSQSTIIGKVFLDRNRNEIQDEGEEGVPEMTIYMEDGRWITTDASGKYSMPDVSPGTHVLRLDVSERETLPGGNRFLGSGNSQFVDINQPGGLYKANFALKEAPANKEAETAKPAPKTAVAPAPPELTWEERLENMTPELAILSPADGSIAAGDQINVMLKAAEGVQLALKVNGEVIPPAQIGRSITHPGKRIALQEYISVPLKPGHRNQLAVEMRDNFGNVRGQQAITVLCAGAPALILITPEQQEITADGQSELKVRIAVFDRDKLPIRYDGLLSLELSAGEILEEDLDTARDGHQLPYRDGLTCFRIRAPRESGQATIRATFDEITETREIFFAPHLRDFLLLGVGELTLGRGSGDDFSGMTHSSNDWAQQGSYAGFRGAFFAKGKISENLLLTAAYDSHQPEREDFFRENTTDPDSEEKYPIYGDESRGGFEAQSRDKLYLRLDHGKSRLLYGDFHTDFNDTMLSQYTRTFTGLKADLNTERLKVSSFIAHSDQVQVVDTIAGRGISGYYFLTHDRVIDGSERVVLEVRDRLRPGQILSRANKSRGTDYEIDYEDGTILFKAPVPTHDEELNPIFLSITYECESEDEKQFNYGTRAVVKLSKNLDLGLTGIVEENPISDETLFGTDLTVRLPANSILKAEIAQSDSLFDSNQTLEAASDQAWAVDFESKPLDNLKLHAYHRDIGEDFQNPSATDAQRGRRESAFDLEYQFDSKTSLFGQVIDTHDRFYDNTQFLAKMKLEKQFQKSKISLQISHENSSDKPIPVTILRPFQSLGRSSFDINDETLEDSLAVTLASETQLWKNLSLTLSHTQELQDDQNSLSQVGLQVRVPGKGRVFIKEERAKYTERSELNTLFGLEADIAQNTVGFQEYRLADGMDGESMQQSIGLRNKFRLTDTLSGNLSLENQTTTRGAERRNRPDAFAAATAAEYLPSDTLKITSRLEYRNASDSTTQLAELGLAHKLSPGLSFLSRMRYFRDEYDQEGSRTVSRLLAGFSYRPIAHDRLNLLQKFEYKHETDGVDNVGKDCDSYIASLEMIYQFSPRFQLAAKYAGKLVSDYGEQTYTDLISTRLSYDLSERFDTSIGYRLLNAHTANVLSHGGFLECGVKVVKNLWLTAGYSCDAFDSDLTGNRKGLGPYLKLRLKVDENSLTGGNK
ncbi:MAG: DUF11 domain-containing protein [Oligosphaeraceae bacterium]|nr:DUF11 domain-containing protein [Oligosphaeraceae bacterium]